MITGLGERDHHPLDLRVEGSDGVLQMRDVVHRDLQDDGVVVAEASSQRFAQLGKLLAQRAFGERGERVGIAFAGDQRREHRPARDSEDVRGDRIELDARVFEDFLHPLLFRGVGLDQSLAIAGEIS